jgi:hypothetical protein
MKIAIVRLAKLIDAEEFLKPLSIRPINIHRI